jgi:hypothetical protein
MRIVLLEVFNEDMLAWCQGDYTDDVDSMHPWNVDIGLRDYTASYLIMLSSTYSPPWEPEIYVFKIVTI